MEAAQRPGIHFVRADAPDAAQTIADYFRGKMPETILTRDHPA